MQPPEKKTKTSRVATPSLERSLMEVTHHEPSVSIHFWYPHFLLPHLDLIYDNRIYLSRIFTQDFSKVCYGKVLSQVHEGDSLIKTMIQEDLYRFWRWVWGRCLKQEKMDQHFKEHWFSLKFQWYLHRQKYGQAKSYWSGKNATDLIENSLVFKESKGVSLAAIGSWWEVVRH